MDKGNLQLVIGIIILMMGLVLAGMSMTYGVTIGSGLFFIIAIIYIYKGYQNRK